jgi:hypothetical protein
MEEAERWLKHQHRVYCLGRSQWRGTSARELEHTASYRLGVDIRENSSAVESPIARGSYRR